MKKAWRLPTASIFWLASVLNGAAVDDTLASARKALLNDGVATAWKLAQQALADAPQSAAAHELAGEVLFRRGEFAPAESEFQTAAKLNPKFALAWWGLARVAECSSRYKTAGQDLQTAHELDPRDPKIFRDWAMHLSGQPHIDAVERYASTLDPIRQTQDLQAIGEHLRLYRALPVGGLNVLATPYEKAEIPLPAQTTQSRTRYFALDVTLNDTLLHLVLDTGATGIVIPARLAQKAGLTRLAAAAVNGIGSNAKLASGYRGLAARVHVGNLEYHNVLIQVSNQEEIGLADGLIGSDLFGDFLVTLDFKARKLRLQPFPDGLAWDDELHDRNVTAGLRSYTPVFRFGHMLLLPTRVSGSREVLFMIDTGADRTFISYEMAAEVSKLARDEKQGITGVNGRVTDVYQTGDLFVEFAGFRQKNLGMTSFDMWDQSRRIGTQISGFLGLSVLDLFTLTIDYRDGLVNFDRQDP